MTNRSDRARQSSLTARPDDPPELGADGQPAPVRDALPADVLLTPAEGLDPRPQPAKRVIVIGGGLAGLVAAFELRRQGHEPLVLEAQNRVGGRIYTLRDVRAGAVRGGRRRCASRAPMT